MGGKLCVDFFNYCGDAVQAGLPGESSRVVRPSFFRTSVTNEKRALLITRAPSRRRRRKRRRPLILRVLTLTTFMISHLPLKGWSTNIANLIRTVLDHEAVSESVCTV